MFARLAVVAALAEVPFAAGAQTPAAGASTPVAPVPVTQQRFADGNDWHKSSLENKRTFVYGIANALSVAIGWEERHVPAGQVTFSRRARDGLAGTTLAEAVDRIDAGYAANPGRRDTPLVAVLWLDIAKPRLQGRK